jgi:ribosomal protein L10
MKDLKKMMKEEDSSMMEMKPDIMKKALRELSQEMSRASSGSALEEMAKPKASVTVATDDPEKMPEALEKAKEMAEQMPEMGDESEEESDDVDSMSLEDLKEMVRALKKKA